jgi:hypothetical protein
LGGRGPSVSVWPSGQGERQAYPRRWPICAYSRQDGDGRHDRGDLVAPRIVADENSITQMLTSMRVTPVRNRIVPSAQVAVVSKETEPALSVATVNQDPLTRHWTTELWDRVGQLVGHGGIRHQSWKISDLTDARVFTHAIQVAAKADMLVVSVRDAGELPAHLHVWIDAWMPLRAGREGALVALIGIPPQPDTQSGRAHAYLETVARQTGLDFLPRERKLPAEPSALPALSRFTPVANLTMPGAVGAPGHNAGVRLQSRLTE